LRSSSCPVDSSSASTLEPAFLPFSATSEYHCSGSSSRPPACVASCARASRTPRRGTQPVTGSHAPPPKRQRPSRRSARHAGARIAYRRAAGAATNDIAKRWTRLAEASTVFPRRRVRRERRSSLSSGTPDTLTATEVATPRPTASTRASRRLHA
jgi:hypothetical protein